MKIQYFIFCILFMLIGCNPQNDSVVPTEKDNQQDNITSSYYFKGDVFGKRLVMQDGLQEVINQVFVSYPTKAGKSEPESVDINVQLGTNPALSATRRLVGIYCPSIPYESFSSENVKTLFSAGKKVINQSKSVIERPYENFTITFETNDPIYAILGNKAFTSVGSQSSDSYLEIVEVKEIKPAIGWNKGLEVKFRFSCSMYSVNDNKYAGDIKNAEWVSKIYY
jgi:hypothetical protein